MENILLPPPHPVRQDEWQWQTSSLPTVSRGRGNFKPTGYWGGQEDSMPKRQIKSKVLHVPVWGLSRHGHTHTHTNKEKKGYESAVFVFHSVFPFPMNSGQRAFSSILSSQESSEVG